MSELSQEDEIEQLRQEAIEAVEAGPGDDPTGCDVTPNDAEPEDPES